MRSAMTEIVVSRLAHTWLIDVDGTLLSHNGYLHGQDSLLPGVREFWSRIPDGDTVILLSARAEHVRDACLAVFDQAGLRYDHVLFGLPKGERVLINDQKPGGLVTALAVSVTRDAGLAELEVVIDQDL
jgi:hypothetical protein